MWDHSCGDQVRAQRELPVSAGAVPARSHSISLLLLCHPGFGFSVCRCHVAVEHKLYSIFRHAVGGSLNRARHSKINWRNHLSLQ